MAVEEQEDFKDRKKRGTKNVQEGRDTSPEIWTTPVPPYMTVDELWLYRKKRPPFDSLKDNLKIEEGSFQQLKTEYRRRFKNFYEALKSSINENEKTLFGTTEVTRPQASLKLEGTQDHLSEYNESFNIPILQRPIDSEHRIMNEDANNEINRLQSFGNILEAVPFGSPRRCLYRRPTNIKLEGDFNHVTEHAEKFIEYLLAKRAELCRTPTTLKLGPGEMESKTEYNDQFIKYETMDRPSLCRKFTNLHLDDALEIVTEKQEKFKPFEVQSRPPLVKRSTNLHLEGDHSLMPEYRHQYIQYDNPERPAIVLPSHNLKSARLFEDSIVEGTTFGRKSPLIPFLRETYGPHDADDHKKYRRSNSSSRYQSNVSLNRTSSHPNLVKSAKIDDRKMTPRSPQRNAYLNVDPGQVMSVDRRRSRRRSGVGTEPDDKTHFTEHHLERPSVFRPPSNFTIDGEVDYLTEKNDKYRQYSRPEHTKSDRRKSGPIFDDPFSKSVEAVQVFEGPFECQPEYRKAYIDYLIRERPPAGHRRRILEIPDININDQSVVDISSSPKDNTEKIKPTSPQERPKSSGQQTRPSSASVPSTPKPPKPSPPSGNKTLPSKAEDKPRRRSSDVRQRSFPRSLTPSPVPPDRVSTPSPNLGGNWRKQTLQESASINPNIWNSMEADPAFLILDDRVQSRRSIRNDLYKEQKWMPSWYNGAQ